MTRYVAFLRAVNVAGHAVVKMGELEGAFAAAGCKNVRTFIQSGNVIFDLHAGGENVLSRAGEGLSRLIGAPATVVYRTLPALQEMAAASPFEVLSTGDDAKLYVSLLSEQPGACPPLPIRAPKDGLEVLAIRHLDVFVVSRKTGGRYGFPNILVEKAFKVPATTRNWNTIRRIVERFSGGDPSG